MRHLIIILLFSYGTSTAQILALDSLKSHVETGFIGSTGKTPFLLRANKYGQIPIDPNFLYLNGGLHKGYTKGKIIDYSFGAEAHINIGATTRFMLPQAYVKGRYKALEIYVGRVKEVVGLTDTLGTIGSYIWSGNALPVPKIDIGIREFRPIVKSKIISVKGNFAHGWFGSGDSVQNVYLHQKSLYVRLGKPAWKIKLISGFNHQVQWGGKPTVPYTDPISGQFITKYDVSLKNFLRVLTGVSIGEQTGQTWDDVTGLPANEAGNRVGNHLGTLDVGAELSLGRYSLNLYRQSIFEDGSLFYLSNITDGLSGLGLKGPNAFHLTIEYLDTRNQAGPIYYGNIPELRGVDNYLNNSIYKDSWTYKGRSIGNALLNPYHENPEALAHIDQKINKNYIYNNRVQAFHINFSTNLAKRYHINTQLVHSRNLGHYVFPIDQMQVSWKQAVMTQMKQYTVKLQLAGDTGSYLRKSVGAQISVLRSW